MSYPNQKRYSLDDAVRKIEHDTGEPCSINNLFQLAKDKQIGICFFVADKKLKFIRLDENGNRWQSVECEHLFKNKPLKRVVIPIDNTKQESHIIQTINPRDENVFPVINGNALETFANHLGSVDIYLSHKNTEAKYSIPL